MYGAYRILRSVLHPQLGLLLALLLMTGCHSLILRPDDSAGTTTGKMIARGVLFLPTFGASERRINRYRNEVPITDGFHTRLSPRSTTVVIVGSNSSANNAATIWLQKRGLSILERTQLDRVITEQQFRLIHSSDEEDMLLRAGRMLGASEMVFVDSTPTSVAVRSVDLESGKIGWTGSAHYRDKRMSEQGDGNMKLTCQALATAWGFRQPGDFYIPSLEMCELSASKSKD